MFIAPRPAADKHVGVTHPGGGVRLTLHDRDGSRSMPWGEVGQLDWSKFAMVLGAGGATGLSFEAGCLLALATDHRIRFGEASAVVGTSAGAIAASLIALGFEGDDLAAVVARVDHYLEPALATLGVRFERDLPGVPGAAQLLRRPTIGSTATGVALLLRRRFTAMLINSVRTGTFDLAQQLGFLQTVDWSSLKTDLHVCAASVPNGVRRVFTASSGVPLVDAVAASCSIPGVMRPVVIGGEAYVDSGLISPANADVLSGLIGRLIVVVSPDPDRSIPREFTIGLF